MDEILNPYKSTQSDFGLKHLLILIGAFIALRFLYNVRHIHHLDAKDLLIVWVVSEAFPKNQV